MRNDLQMRRLEADGVLAKRRDGGALIFQPPFHGLVALCRALAQQKAGKERERNDLKQQKTRDELRLRAELSGESRLFGKGLRR